MVEEELQKMGMTPLYHENLPKYLPYGFEENDYNENRLWARKQLPTFIGISFLYFIFVFLGPRVMRNRKPFDLQRPLAVWNFSLALFSMGFVIRCLPQFLDTLLGPNGFYISTCIRSPVNQTATYWEFMYAVSKIAELVDTVFIVLRKKKLIFLHWFHHMVLIYVSFFLFSEAEPLNQWSTMLNTVVHSVMYSYYGLMALRFKLPRGVAMTVTTIQLIQFFVSAFLNWYTAAVWATGGDCYRTRASVKIYGVVGTAFLVLFLKLFYKSYIAKPKTKTD